MHIGPAAPMPMIPRVTISCGSARFTLPVMPVEDYPTLPTMPTAAGVVDSATFATAVGQVAVAPERLRHAEQDAQIEAEQGVKPARPEERPVDEVVRDGVGVPPQTHGDDRQDRRSQQQAAVGRGQRHEQGVPRRMPQDARPRHVQGGSAHG